MVHNYAHFKKNVYFIGVGTSTLYKVATVTEPNTGRSFFKCNHLFYFRIYEVKRSCFLLTLPSIKPWYNKDFKFPQSCFCETSGQEIKPLISYTCALIASIIIMDPLVYMYLSCLIPWKRYNLHFSVLFLQVS